MTAGHTWFKAWVAGVLCAVPVALWALALQTAWPSLLASGTLPWALQQAFVHAAIPEETIKMLALLWVCRAGTARMTPKVAMQSGAALGFGFACVETLLHAVVGDAWSAVVVRLFSSIPCHVALGIVMAAFAVRAVNWRGLLLAWFLPVLCHGLYNLPLLMPKTLPLAQAPPPMLLSITVLVFLVLWARDLGSAPQHKSGPIQADTVGEMPRHQLPGDRILPAS